VKNSPLVLQEGTAMLEATLDAIRMIRPRRRITGMSAVLLPFDVDGSIDWRGFLGHVARTADAGLTPAVNMDTGYVNLLDAATRRQILDQTRAVLGSRPFVAGPLSSTNPIAHSIAMPISAKSNSFNISGALRLSFSPMD